MRVRHRTDYQLIVMPCIIFLMGLVFLFSASSKGVERADFNIVLRQLLWMAFGLMVAWGVSRVHYQRIQDWAWPIYGVALITLVLVFFTPARLGAHRWIEIGAFNLQPSEIGKIAVILTLASFFKERRHEEATFKDYLFALGVAALPIGLIMKEPDLGTALLLVPILLSLFYVWGFPFRWIAAWVTTGLVSCPILYHFLKEYQKKRILIFLDPDRDPLGAGYTIIQSKIAVGSGGFWGKGFMQGSQTQLRFLPESHTDFIFSVIGEEGGFVIMFLVILAYWILIAKGYRIAYRCSSRFGQYLATGITSLLAAQAIINMCMTLGLLPVVGVPLFLMSYGGSSIISSMFLIGILMSIDNHREVL